MRSVEKKAEKKAAQKKPSARVRGSRTGRPVMRLLDLLGRRWALRVLWELRAGPATFRGLRERCEDVSPSVLNTRLAELREAGVIELAQDGGYALTAAGRALAPSLVTLDAWARKHLAG